MDWAMEKLTELGVGTISFFHSQFTSVRAYKTEHLHKVTISAMKQSKQVYLPKINSPLPLSEWVESIAKKENQILLLAHLNNTSMNISEIQFKHESVIVAIGPEGGFSNEEIKQAQEHGFKLVRIDNHILRTETAVVIAAAQLKMLIARS
jgi:16S rRNA (uracil1498-N3)-methyltransferase